jgi:hypothetical protein
MMKEWQLTTTNFLREHLDGLKAGNLVHEEIADELMYMLMDIMGVAYLDSCGLLHPAKGPERRLRKDLEILDETVAAGTLVLSCLYSAQVECGKPKFLKKWQRDGFLKPFSRILWPKSGCKHFTTVCMDLNRDENQEVTAVEVLLADSNWAVTKNQIQDTASRLGVP